MSLFETAWPVRRHRYPFFFIAPSHIRLCKSIVDVVTSHGIPCDEAKTLLASCKRHCGGGPQGRNQNGSSRVLADQEGVAGHAPLDPPPPPPPPPGGGFSAPASSLGPASQPGPTGLGIILTQACRLTVGLMDWRKREVGYKWIVFWSSPAPAAGSWPFNLVPKSSLHGG
jgi:hypothetical protein